MKRIEMDKIVDREKLAKELESELKEMKEEHDIVFAGIFFLKKSDFLCIERNFVNINRK